MTPNVYIDQINILRRADSSSASRDSLNNPVYNDPTTWSAVYSNIKARLMWSGKSMVFAATGEIIKPQGICYIPANIIVKPQDRIVTVVTRGYPTGIEYVVTEIIEGYSMMNGPVSFQELKLALPI